MRNLLMLGIFVAVAVVSGKDGALMHESVGSNQVRPKVGSISGTVVGLQARPVVAATVTALPKQFDPALRPKEFTALTNDKGQFIFRALPAGIYELRVSTEDYWLFKQVDTTVTVRSSENTVVQIKRNVVDQCGENGRVILTGVDRSAIIKFMLDEAIGQRKIPSYQTLVRDRKIIVSSKNVEPHQMSNVSGLEFLFLSGPEIQMRADRNEEDLMFLSFEMIEPRGSCVAVSLCNRWEDGTSSLETGEKTLLGEGCLYYVFRKRSGTWNGQFISGWVS